MSEEKLIVDIPGELAGKRMDQALSILFPMHSRSRIQGWIKAGHVKVQNQNVRQKEPVKGGETVEILPLYDIEERWTGEDIQLDIIYEDDEIIVLNKPSGLVVHPGAGNPTHTLLNALLHHDSCLEKVPRAGIVQRLDKDTSGIMVIAKTPTSHTYLVEKLQLRDIKREYQAIVTGVMTSGGRIEAPIGRHKVHRKRMAVTDNGKQAITHYRVLKKYPSYTRIQVNLETGRTHQIRVHMAHIHYPIVGDPIYAGRPRLPKNASQELRDCIQSFPRQALHASALELEHPKSHQAMSWTAPLPDDIQGLINILDYDVQNG